MSRDADLVPKRLRASWIRSERYGVSADAVEPVFAGTEPPESLFHECGNEVLADLHRTMESEPVGMMLTDSEGVVLSRVSGDHSLLRALDVVHLAPGFGYSEREVGTNGLGLALADITPTLVRADQHYSHSLTGFTCAAAPVVDPVTGKLEGAVNLTTWSDTSSNLLLTLARSAASTISSSMLTRGSQRHARPPSRRNLFRIEHPSSVGGLELGQAWSEALTIAATALAAGSVVAAVGPPSTGRATLLAQAARRAFPRHRILSAAAPDLADIQAWLDLWSFEVGRSDTVVVLRDVDTLPAYAAGQLRDLLFGAGGTAMPVAMSAETYHDVPSVLANMVTAVASVPPLRDRPDDVLPLARHMASTFRGREVQFSRAAEQALRNYDWPHDAAELARVITRAVNRSDVVDTHVLPTEILAGPARRLSSIEAFEHGEIVRVLSSGRLTMQQAATQLGMSRATLYRKIGYYKIDVTRGE
ncbi:GAF domain-containing protein [Rhodococcoides kyotonense]|uniref:Regulatory protein, Fis family n=1 Tax=Rhodococcoides kyotonense TaxID=398843 RepID=A0A239DRM9_9NOCA|nr:GAF domain-containing protein [Rhodococcus kyotonensis]SNS35285.1 regulatory protein, Fis family [Rhodococcus kyotonensis]